MLKRGLGDLTYCLNIHPAETWPEVRAALDGPVRAVRDAHAPGEDFALGLRLSARAVADLTEPSARAELKAILAAEGYRAVTVNGFPYGRFHGTPVKAEVYRPDWREDARLAYTCALADLMAEIAPEDCGPISLSTAPGCFKPFAAGAEAAMTERFLQAAAHCVRLAERTGRTVGIAIEPEPFCFLETIAETVAFFEARLYSAAAADRLAALSGLTRPAAETALRRHLGLCYDVCHAAVEFEDVSDSFAALAAAGIPVLKLQASAALRVREVTAETRRAIAAFDEPTYLHQVVSRRNGRLVRYPDLPEALARGAAEDGAEWRVHFHVPIFVSNLGVLASTQDFLAEALALQARAPVTPLVEVETYSFGVLPPSLDAGTVEAAVIRELAWARQALDA